MSRKGKIVLACLFGALLIVLFSVVRYFTQTRIVPISAKNISSVSLRESSEDVDKNKDYSANTKSVRVWKNKTYSLTYKGTDGYANGSININQQTTTITIDPDYSQAKNSALLAEAAQSITAALYGSVPRIDQYYQVSRGSIMNHGQWYLTNLIYKGSSDDESSDTLTTGLQKVGNEWKVVLFPNILFTTSANEGVSKSFIDAANNYRFNTVTPAAESY